MAPDDIPTSVTDLIYSAPFKNQLSQNNVAELLAHFWPAIRTHFLNEGRELIGTASEARLDAIDEDERDPSDWDRHHAWLDAADVLKDAAQGAGQ